MSATRFDYQLWTGKARAVRGTALPHARLDDDKVRAIRAAGKTLTAKQLGRQYGVHWRTIEKVRSGETWSHVR